MPWQQVYDPLNNTFLTTLAAITPVVILLGCLAVFHVKAHYAALLGLCAALVVSIAIFWHACTPGCRRDRVRLSIRALPIGWFIVNVIFLYQVG
jgi:lactate permease